MAVAPWPGPPARRNTGAAAACRLSAGTTAMLKSMVALPGRVLSSGTLSTPQRAGIDASRSGCSRRHSCRDRRPTAVVAAAAAGRVHRQFDTRALNEINVLHKTPEYRAPGGRMPEHRTTHLSTTFLRALDIRDLL